MNEEKELFIAKFNNKIKKYRFFVLFFFISSGITCIIGPVVFAFTYLYVFYIYLFFYISFLIVFKFIESRYWRCPKCNNKLKGLWYPEPLSCPKCKFIFFEDWKNGSKKKALFIKIC